jgi:opacity protein-like surface antigen
MKKIIATASFMALATSAGAMDLPVPGMSLDTEVKAWHKVDAETNHLTINPEINWQPAPDGALTLSVGTVITAYDSSLTGDTFVLFDTLDEGSRPNIDLGADYVLGNGTELFAKTSWDIDAEDRTEIEVGVSFSF